MRYFTDPFDPILMRYTRFIGGNKPVKNATPVTIGESYVWNVHYWFGNNADLYYLNGPSPTGYRFDMPIVSTPIVRTDDLFNLNAPLEFKAAILNVAFKELERK
jgi:hypothetical protein